MEQLLEAIADYVCNHEIESDEAYQTARVCLADSLGCLFLAENFPDCMKLLGPVVEGTVVPNGSRVPGTSYVLDPVTAAFNIGTLIRWLDYNDTWLAQEWGHPSDNLGGILAVADCMKVATIKEILTAMIKAYEIQGILALDNCFNRLGFDHVILVKVATAAVAVRLLGGSEKEVVNALSQAWIDAGPLRTYRHAPNTGSRKSWAAGDATARGVQLALMTMKGEMGYPGCMDTPEWGVNDALMRGNPITLERPLSSYVMENILFKVAFPAEFHAQTAVECALKLHPEVKDRIDEIERINILTQEPAMRIINKSGPLKNPADRDHCLQYMVAVPLILGALEAKHYEEETADDPRIDRLRKKMVLDENFQFSKDYLDPDKRSIANEITVRFQDGTTTDTVCIEYPIGHRRRREEAIPLLFAKLRQNLLTRLSKRNTDDLVELFQNHEELCRSGIDRIYTNCHK